MKYSCLVFSEGGRDKKFLMALIDLKKFKYHTPNWFFNYDNASGSSPETILSQCGRAILGKSFDLVLCFIDLDALKTDYQKTWETEKTNLEKRHTNIKIIWQIDKAEDEYKKVLGDQCCGKHRLNIIAKTKVEKFINSDFWQRILRPIREKEEELKKIK